MSRATDTQKAKRLNLAQELLRHRQLPEAASELAQTCAISHRQAYRYLEQAQHLKEPVPVGDSKLTFTVKLSRTLVDRLRVYASSTGLTLSDIVSRAVLRFLNRGSGRGWKSGGW
jgi:predicted DNA-binding transcriptional regulator YafY